MKTAHFICIGICSMILIGANLLRIDLPDFLIRIVGLVDLAALSVLGYRTVKMRINQRQ